MAEALEGWTDFNVAMVGAAAALAGLLIVAMSVNISAILSSPELPARAGASIAGLVLAIVASAIGLMPDQSAPAYGAAVLVAALVAGAIQLAAVRAIIRNGRDSPTERVVRGAMGLLPIAGFAIGAVLVLAGATGAGLPVIAYGAVLAVIVSIIMAWVVLVEVLR
jgi:hypothetical protein